jgi:hypothetical protein
MVATSLDPVLGNVEVDGVVYRIAPVGADRYEAVRVADSQSVGTVVGAGGEWLWRLQSECPELMHAIVQEAIASGFLQAPPSD